MLAARFRHFADVECPEEPLYRAICRIVADDAALLGLLDGAPPEHQRANLWLAALHDRLLARVAAGRGHALADHFASCGGERAPDPALRAALRDFADEESTALRECMRTRSTQTNETGRCAVLWPALQEIARRCGGRPLALLDLGCSAGLNLGVDRYRYVYGDFALGVPAAAGVTVMPCRLVGLQRPDAQAAAPRIVQRLGIDPAPIDVHDERAVRWLRACLWPSDRVRAGRLDRAVALARTHGWPVRREADCTGAVEGWLDGLPDGVQPVVFNSWVLAYFDAAALQRHVDVMRAAVRERGAVWLSAEEASLRIGSVDAPKAATAPGLEWMLCERTAGGRAAFDLLARSHGHGRWMEWLAGPR